MLRSNSEERREKMTWRIGKVFLEKLLKDEKYFNLELIYAKDKLIKVIEK